MPVRRLADHFHPVHLPEQVAQFVTRRLLVVGNHRRQGRRGHDAILLAVTVNGMTTRARAPCPGAPVRLKRSPSP